MEIYVCNANAIVWFDIAGNSVDSFAFETTSWFLPIGLSAVDIDGDGKHELIVLGCNQYHQYLFDYLRLWAFNEGLDPLPGWCGRETGLHLLYNSEVPVVFHPAFCDLDSDGSLEYVIARNDHDLDRGSLYSWNTDGSPYPHNGDPLLAESTTPGLLHLTTAVDIDGDGLLEVATGETPGHSAYDGLQYCLAWDNTGELLDDSRWPLCVGLYVDSGYKRSNAPVIGDLDGDSLVDMFMTTANNRLVFTEFSDYTYNQYDNSCPFWRYNRSMDNTAVPRTCDVCGDVNCGGDVDIDDAVYIIAYIFITGETPQPYESGDADCSGTVDIDDVVYLIAYIFSSGPPPCDGC